MGLGFSGGYESYVELANRARQQYRILAMYSHGLTRPRDFPCFYFSHRIW